MRILYLAPHEPWPLNTGARLRDYHLARELAHRASVTFAGVRNETDPESPAPPSDCGFERTVMLTKKASYTAGNVLRGLAGPMPVTILNYWSDQMRRQIATLVEEGRFDSVQVEAVHFAMYLDVIRAASSRPVLISDWHNIESEMMWRYGDKASLPRKFVARRTAALIEGVERQILSVCDACTVVSEREREKIQAMFGYADAVVIPNGMAVADYSAAEMANAMQQSPVSLVPGYLLFVGSMDYHANVEGVTWFVGEVWPRLRKRFPEVKLAIVGRNPSPAVLKLQGPDVVVTGTVADVRPYYAGASAMVAPLRVGSGTRLKILEAMAAGVPVVATRLGAEGIDVSTGNDILLADTAEDFANAVERILESPDLATSIVGGAKKLVEDHYDWRMIGARLFALHEDVVQRKRS